MRNIGVFGNAHAVGHRSFTGLLIAAKHILAVVVQRHGFAVGHGPGEQVAAVLVFTVHRRHQRVQHGAQLRAVARQIFLAQGTVVRQLQLVADGQHLVAEGGNMGFLHRQRTAQAGDIALVLLNGRLLAVKLHQAAGGYRVVRRHVNALLRRQLFHQLTHLGAINTHLRRHGVIEIKAAYSHISDSVVALKTCLTDR